MSCFVLWSVCVVASPMLGTSAPTSAMVRAADDETPQRRSRDDEAAGPRIQMGAGPTALAMMALLAAVIGRSLRRRRADPRMTL